MKRADKSQAGEGPFNFTDMVLSRRDEQESGKRKDGSKKSRMDELRNRISALRGEATNANYVIQDLKSRMSRGKGDFVQAYTQTAAEMRSRLESIRNEIQSMGAAIKSSKAMALADDEHHDDHHEDEAHLAHMDVETHEIERASIAARGKAGLHILESHPDGRRHGYTAPIEADLHALLHDEQPVNAAGNNAMKLSRSLDIIAADFDKANVKGVTDISAESRFSRGGDTTLSAG